MASSFLVPSFVIFKIIVSYYIYLQMHKFHDRKRLIKGVDERPHVNWLIENVQQIGMKIELQHIWKSLNAFSIVLV